MTTRRNKGTLRRGQRLGKYRLKSRLGEGGFGTVWRAHDSVEGIDVALKIPFERFADTLTLKEFRAEARLQARLDHPHILKIKSAEMIDGNFVIATELAKGTLAGRAHRALSTRKAFEYFAQILSALAYAHEQKILHRDIKPENILVFRHERLRLTDFGIARIVEKTHASTTVSGTIGYMAPEAAYGRPSKASDVFSAGLILWRMLTGRDAAWPFAWPFAGYKAFARKVQPEVEHFIRRACAFDPRRRFRDAGEMQKAFAAMAKKVLRRR